MQRDNKVNKRQARYLRDLQPFVCSMTLAYRKGAPNEDDPLNRFPSIPNDIYTTTGRYFGVPKNPGRVRPRTLMNIILLLLFRLYVTGSKHAHTCHGRRLCVVISHRFPTTRLATIFRT
jgi:hypothetical protein